MAMMRWLYHVRPRALLSERIDAPSLGEQGFVHCSFADRVHESAAIYFPDRSDLELLRIDPRRLDVRVDVAETPRGPMPHVHGSIPRDAVRAQHTLDESLDDEVRGTHFVFVAFEGMTLLDLVGIHDPINRIRTMGFDPTSRCTIVGAQTSTVWSQDGAHIEVDAVRPPLDDADVLVLPGGPETRALTDNANFVAWLRTFPENRWLVTVCTGALLAGVAGRLLGRRATTHASALETLADYGATAVRDRIVVDGPVTTAGGVTAGIDLGLHVVERLVGADARRTIADRMEYREI